MDALLLSSLSPSLLSSLSLLSLSLLPPSFPVHMLQYKFKVLFKGLGLPTRRERARGSDQTRTALCARRGRPGLPLALAAAIAPATIGLVQRFDDGKSVRILLRDGAC